MTLLLAGIAVNAFLSALVSFVYFGKNAPGCLLDDGRTGRCQVELYYGMAPMFWRGFW